MLDSNKRSFLDKNKGEFHYTNNCTDEDTKGIQAIVEKNSYKFF
jgi:hypothetical protein